MLRIAFPHEIRPDGINPGMFIPSIESSGTDEQKEKWLPLAKNYQIIGTYAQTELGHGKCSYQFV